MIQIPTFKDIIDAHLLIKNKIHKTPVLSSNNLDIITGASLFFKCENFQKVGAFKFRGATNAVFNLKENELQNGVATHSSGNHAAALALAAQIRNTKAYIVMPENAPVVKINAVKGYNAEIIFCKPTLQARESTLEEVINKTNATFIHPYNNPKVISGQGTAAVELLEHNPDLDIIMAPVGGGGLLSGTAISAKNINKNIKVFAAEPKGADDAYKSFINKEIIPSINPKTIADGLLTSLGTITFEVIINYVDNIFTVSEDSIIKAMQLTWERMKIIIEPSSAVPLAAVLENKDVFLGKKVGIIISGGNVDLTKLPF